MNKKISLGSAIAFMAIVAAATFSITMIFSMRSFNDMVHNIREREVMFSKLAEINNYCRLHYYGNINETLLLNDTVEGYIAGLNDPYAQYFTAEEYARLNQSYEDAEVGIGIVTEQDTGGYLVVKEVYADSSALNSGIAVGDIIVRIDDTDITASNMEEMTEAVYGASGTKVRLTIRRENVDSSLEVTRRYVEKPTVYSRMFGTVGYIQITEFNDNTPDQFNRMVERVRSEGALSLIFDVRGNPGGTIYSVSRVLDRLLPEGDIVSATYKDGSSEVLATSDASELDMPMVVLANEATASAAELFTQALKDYEKAKSVGVTTKGKGSMQQVQKLSDGSAIDLTVALYNPPKSQNFNGVGVKPDFEVRLTNEQQQVVSLHDPEQDPQLKKALDLANGSMAAISNSSNAASTPAA